MTDRFRRVYANTPEVYESLIAREDVEGRLLPALRERAPLDGDIVEFGAGTGRITRLLAPTARSLRAFDASPAMLALGRRRVPPRPRLALVAAANHALPVASASADLALAGWTFGHATGWNPEGWETEIRGFLDEMQRVLRPGGSAIVIETLGTGRTEPESPNAALAAYYRLLETLGFRRSWIRTDYRFASREEADRLCLAFFGTAFALEPEGTAWRLPECTGLWHRTRPASSAR